MRNPLLIALLVLSVAVACDTKTPTGPSQFDVTNTSTSTTALTTIATTTPPTTIEPPPTLPPTTIPLLGLNRTWVAFGPITNPSQPASLTMLLQPISPASASGSRSWSGTLASVVERLSFWGPQADPVFGVLGSWRAANGGGGIVSGTLFGTFETGFFRGTLTSETPECSAEREFEGPSDPQFLRLSGGRTFNDCKGNPLAFTNITMLVSQAPLPTTTVGASTTTTIPLQCGYSLSRASDTFPKAGAERTVGLVTGLNCGWSTQTFVEWIKVTPSVGSGPATIVITVAPNPGPPRSATVVIAGIPFIVNQE
jgi:hypothetical protein